MARRIIGIMSLLAPLLAVPLLAGAHRVLPAVPALEAQALAEGDDGGGAPQPDATEPPATESGDAASAGTDGSSEPGLADPTATADQGGTDSQSAPADETVAATGDRTTDSATAQTQASEPRRAGSPPAAQSTLSGGQGLETSDPARPAGASATAVATQRLRSATHRVEPRAQRPRAQPQRHAASASAPRRLAAAVATLPAVLFDPVDWVGYAMSGGGLVVVVLLGLGLWARRRLRRL